MDLRFDEPMEIWRELAIIASLDLGERTFVDHPGPGRWRYRVRATGDAGHGRLDTMAGSHRRRARAAAAPQSSNDLPCARRQNRLRYSQLDRGGAATTVVLLSKRPSVKPNGTWRFHPALSYERPFDRVSSLRDARLDPAFRIRVERVDGLSDWSTWRTPTDVLDGLLALAINALTNTD